MNLIQNGTTFTRVRVVLRPGEQGGEGEGIGRWRISPTSSKEAKCHIREHDQRN